MARNKDIEWDAGDIAGNGGRISHEQAHLAVLMDIRDEMKRLNALLHCHNFIAIPQKLDALIRKIPARKKPKGKSP